MPQKGFCIFDRAGWVLAAACSCLAATSICAETRPERPFPSARFALKLGATRIAPLDIQAPLRAPSLPAAALAPARGSGSFVSAYLAPRITARLGGMDGVLGSPAFLAEPVASSWREDVSRTVERRTIRAARSAARRYLVDRWDLEIGVRRDGGRLAIESGRRVPSTGLRLGFAGLKPRVTWESGAWKLTLDAHGRIGVARADESDRASAFGATIDPSGDRVEAGWRRSF